MQKTSRTRLVAVLTSALVPLSALISFSGAQATPAPAEDTTTPYSRAQAEKILAQVQDALAPKKLAPRKLGDPLPRRDLSLLLRKLQVAKPALSARGQQAAALGDQRPVPDTGSCVADSQPGLPPIQWQVKASTHFCVHYQTSGAGATTSAWVTKTVAALEHVYYYETSHLDFRSPLKDQDGRYDVFLDDIGKDGYYGFCTTDDPTRVSTAWCELDNDFAKDQFGAWPTNSLNVTAAHEFFHAIQFAYDADEDTWFMEGTAVWVEDQVYPKINDYLQYLKYSQITQSEVPIDTTGTFERYGAVIFWKYLSEGYHDVTIIRRIWNAAAISAGARDALRATIAVLSNKHVGFATAFARFSLWNTLPSGSYADRKLFPHPVSWGTAKLGTTARDTGTQNISLDHLSSANLALIPSPALPTKSRLSISVDAPGNHVAQVRVQVRKTNGTTVYPTFTLNSSGNGSHSIYFSGQNITSVRVTLVNVTGTANNQSFKFRARVTLP